MTINASLCEKALKFISNRIKNYTQPESFTKWCELAKTKAGYDKSADSFSRVLRTRLDRIEDLQGFTLIEKVRLVFLFSHKMSPGFRKILKDNKCAVELNGERKMTYFRSREGDCVLQSDQDRNPNIRKFKGKPIHDKKKTVVKPARRSPQIVRKAKPAPNPQIIPNSPDVDDVEMGDKEEEAPGPTPNDSLNIRNQDALARTPGNNEAQNLVQNNRNRVKIEDFLQEKETMSLRKLAAKLEFFSHCIDLDQSFSQKIFRAERLFRDSKQTIPIQEFNHLFRGVLTSLKRERIPNPTRNSIQLVRLFKQLKRNWIDPMGIVSMSEALGILDDEIQKLGDCEDEIPLKTVQGKIDGLMRLITKSWSDMDE